MPATVAWADAGLWQRLAAEPGLVVLMRHAHAAGGNPVVWDATGACAGEAVLTAEGRAQARRVGDAFARLGIKPLVISSPMCRCRETARIAFGASMLTEAELREVGSADAARTAAFERRARALLLAHRGARPLVFVSHLPNIDLLSLELLPEAGLLLAQLSTDGELTVLGRLPLEP